MFKREFVQPTNEEIEARKRMYAEADALGIDLMGYDNSCYYSEERSDRRKDIVIIGTK